MAHTKETSNYFLLSDLVLIFAAEIFLSAKSSAVSLKYLGAFQFT